MLDAAIKHAPGMTPKARNSGSFDGAFREDTRAKLGWSPADYAVYHDDPAATQIAPSTEWVIDLQAFTGVNLTNLGTITLGFGTKNSPAAGGAGKMYFDNIRLYRQTEQADCCRIQQI